MSDATSTPPVKQIVKYRSKKKIAETVQSALDGKVTPVPHSTKPQSPVVTKRGPLPKVAKDFNDDERSLDMAIYIQQGLSIEEAGILARFSPEELKSLHERSESYRRFVELQLIKFKQKHLKVISDKDNPTTSQWLLEQKFPEQYGKKAKGDGGAVGSTQIIQAIVKSVQMSTDELVIHEHDDQKETKDESRPSESGGNQPTLEPGGANIL